MSNRFDGVEKESIHNLIAQTVGAATSPVLWESAPDAAFGDPEPATKDKWGRPCIFQDQKAVEIVNESMDKLREMLEDRLVASGAVDPNDVEMLVAIVLDLEEDEDGR